MTFTNSEKHSAAKARGFIPAPRIFEAGCRRSNAASGSRSLDRAYGRDRRRLCTARPAQLAVVIELGHIPGAERFRFPLRLRCRHPPGAAKQQSAATGLPSARCGRSGVYLSVPSGERMERPRHHLGLDHVSHLPAVDVPQADRRLAARPAWGVWHLCNHQSKGFRNGRCSCEPTGCSRSA